MLTFSTTSPSQPLDSTHTLSTLVSSIGRPGTAPVFPRFSPLPSNSPPTIDRAPFTALRLQAPPAPPERQTRSGYQRCPPPPNAVWQGRLPPPPPPSPIARTAFPGRRPPGHGPGLEQTTPPTSGLNQQLQKRLWSINETTRRGRGPLNSGHAKMSAKHGTQARTQASLTRPWRRRRRGWTRGRHQSRQEIAGVNDQGRAMPARRALQTGH